MISRMFRYPDGVLPNVAALGMILIGWPTGVVLLIQPLWAGKLVGVFMVTLSLVWSAYFVHEFSHLTIFRSALANRRWGTLMCWINGSCYASFDKLRKKHLRHHIERADILTFDIKTMLLAAPAPLRRMVMALEWAYFPAVEFLMRGFVLALPFSRRQRPACLRVCAILLLRCAGFAGLAWLSPTAVALYFFAYVLFITVLRFADCFQHTYDAHFMQDDAPAPGVVPRDRVYEHTNTYSDIVGLDHRWLNLLWLNFGFHNAHHERPAMPWHQLPALHRTLYPQPFAQVIPVRSLLKSFHIHRVHRILAPHYGQVLPQGVAHRADGFLGAVGVSFLTAV